MKTTIKLFNFLLVSLVLTAFSCSKDDDNTPSVQISEPTALLSNANVTATFFIQGQTDVPTVNWNGNTGIFSLASNITGTSVDANTGVVTWNKSLPLGLNTIELVATNSVGETSVNIIIDNQFSGNFDGAFNQDHTSTVTSIPFEMNYNSDGTMLAIGTSEATGTWSRNGNTITSMYVTAGGSDIITVLDLTYSNSDAALTGFFSNGTTLSDPPTGYIALAIE